LLQKHVRALSRPVFMRKITFSEETLQRALAGRSVSDWVVEALQAILEEPVPQPAPRACLDPACQRGILPEDSNYVTAELCIKCTEEKRLRARRPFMRSTGKTREAKETKVGPCPVCGSARKLQGLLAYCPSRCPEGTTLLKGKR